MSEETIDLIVTAVAFVLAAHAWARRNAVVSLVNKEGIADAS
jgi:hypothetical protein